MNTRTMKQPPGGDCHDLFGAEFNGTPCHHRVLKPPGGGSSDIFGTSDVVEQSPRKARNTHHLQSSVFGANGTSEAPMTPRNKLGNDSHNRLFGPVESLPPQSTSIDRMKSNIPFGEEKIDSAKSTSPPSPACDPEELSPTAPKDGNPVTGEGYATANGEETPSPPSGAVSNGSASTAEIRRNRIPPGGYSSGLW